MKASAYALTALPDPPTLALPLPSFALPDPSPADRLSFPAISDEPLEPATMPLVVARAPRARAAMFLALAVVLAPIVAPLCWRFAEAELRAITSGTASGARGRLQLAAMWGAFVTFLGIGFMLAYPVGLLLL